MTFLTHNTTGDYTHDQMPIQLKHPSEDSDCHLADLWARQATGNVVLELSWPMRALQRVEALKD
jgi:hypothetical protein